MERRRRDKYCGDACENLVYQCSGGGWCKALDMKKLDDYDINAHLVKYIKDKDCPHTMKKKGNQH